MKERRLLPSRVMTSVATNCLSPPTADEKATLARAKEYARQLLAATEELEKDHDLRKGKLSSWPADSLQERERLLRERLVATLAAERRGMKSDELMLGPLLAATQKYKSQACNKWAAAPPPKLGTRRLWCPCEFRDACLFSHGTTNKRRDPLKVDYDLKMCDRSADSGKGCPSGEGCGMCHTGVELRTHPIVLMRLMRKGDQTIAKLHGVSLKPDGSLELRAASCRERHNAFLSKLLPPLKSVPKCAPCSPSASSPCSEPSSSSPPVTPSPTKVAAEDAELVPHVEALAMQLCSLVRQEAGKIQSGHAGSRSHGSSSIPPYAIAVTALTPAYVRRFGSVLPDLVRGLGFAKISELLNLPRLARCLKLQLDGSKNQLVIWPVNSRPGDSCVCAHCASRKQSFPPPPSKEVERLLRLAEENGRRDRRVRPGTTTFIDGLRQRASLSSREVSTEDHVQSVRTPASQQEIVTSVHKETAASPPSTSELVPMSLIKRFDDVVANEEASPPPEPAPAPATLPVFSFGPSSAAAPSYGASTPANVWSGLATYKAVAAGEQPSGGASPYAIASPFDRTLASFCLTELRDCSGPPPTAPTWVPGVPFTFFALPPLVPSSNVNKSTAPQPIEEAALLGQLSELLSDGADHWFLDESDC